MESVFCLKDFFIKSTISELYPKIKKMGTFNPFWGRRGVLWQMDFGGLFFRAVILDTVLDISVQKFFV